MAIKKIYIITAITALFGALSKNIAASKKLVKSETIQNSAKTHFETFYRMSNYSGNVSYPKNFGVYTMSPKNFNDNFGLRFSVSTELNEIIIDENDVCKKICPL